MSGSVNRSPSTVQIRPIEPGDGKPDSQGPHGEHIVPRPERQAPKQEIPPARCGPGGSATVLGGRRLDGGGVLAVGADAAGAGPHAGRQALDQQDGLLDVRPPHAVRLSVGVTDVVPKGHRLVTNITSTTHGLAFRGGSGWAHDLTERPHRARPRHPGHQPAHLTGARRAIRRRRTDLRRYNAGRSVPRRLRTSPPLEGAGKRALLRAPLFPQRGTVPPFLRHLCPVHRAARR